MGFAIHLKLSGYFVRMLIDIMPPILMTPSYLATQCALSNILFLYMEEGESIPSPILQKSQFDDSMASANSP